MIFYGIRRSIFSLPKRVKSERRKKKLRKERKNCAHECHTAAAAWHTSCDRHKLVTQTHKNNQTDANNELRAAANERARKIPWTTVVDRLERNRRARDEHSLETCVLPLWPTFILLVQRLRVCELPHTTAIPNSKIFSEQWFWPMKIKTVIKIG